VQYRISKYKYRGRKERSGWVEARSGGWERWAGEGEGKVGGGGGCDERGRHKGGMGR
jgi:hypothetical protein